MRIGLTYDLKQRYLEDGYPLEAVAELDSSETIDAIEISLRVMGYETERIGNVKDLVAALAAGKRWPLVFNIAEGLHGLCREAQIPALLEAYRIPYVFSDSLALVVTLHKGLAKAVVRSHGVPTADYRVIERLEELKVLDMPFPLFIKPVGGGTGMGINGNSIVHNRQQLLEGVERLLTSHGQPVLVEAYLSGREFTVGIVGTGFHARVVGAMEIIVDTQSDHGIYSYVSKQQYKEHVSYHSVDGFDAEQCNDVALSAWRALGCRDGGRVDLRMDNLGKVHFLEVNPLAGLHPVDSDLPILASMAGIDYQSLLSMIMDSAMSRLGFTDEKTHSSIA
ncbi:MAG: D-alanine--D-alanine ligase family protein [Sphaerochaetaceae bacterium]